MNIAQMKEIEDLKEKLDERQRHVRTVYESNVLPLFKQYEKNFIEVAEKHFKTHGFEISEAGSAAFFSATYKSLVFTVSKSSNSILVQKGNDLLCTIDIRCKSYFGGITSIPDDDFLAAKAGIEHRSKGVEKEIEYYSDPEVYYECFDRKFNDPDELMSEILK